MKVWCFYHGSDLDGHCCAAIVRRWCARVGHGFMPRGGDYGRRVDWLEGAGPDAMAVVCDFTPEGDDPAGVLAGMRGAYGWGLEWIDHHATAIAAVGGAGLAVSGARESGTAACVLAWHWFFKGETRPQAVTALGKYDVFDRSDGAEWERAVLPFQYGMRLRRTDPGREGEEPGLWEGLLEDGGMGGLLARVRDEGAVCLRFERERNRVAALAGAYDCVFEGVLCCALNARGNSLVLDAYARREHKMRVLWGFTGGRWRVSLYENGHDDVDCGAVAKRYGGGGHRGAAGFSVPEGLDPLGLFAPVAGLGAGGGSGARCCPYG